MTMPKDPEKAALTKERMRLAQIGRKHSSETKAKMSAMRKGENNPFYGKKLSQDAIDKMRLTKIGKKQSEETKEKRRQSMKKFYEQHPEAIKEKSDAVRGDRNPNYGKEIPPEQKAKMSLAKQGENHWNFGKHIPPEVKERIRIANSGENCYHYGQSPSDETRRKMSEALKGDKCYKWKGGITKLNHAIRTCLQNRDWIMSVFKRDNFTCRKCDATKVYLEAHHIKPFAEIMQEHNIKTLEEAINCPELWDVDNGISYCTECHKDEHFGMQIVSEEGIEYGIA